MNLNPIIIETKRLKLTGFSPQDMTSVFENFSKDERRKILGHRTEEDYQKEEYKYKTDTPPIIGVSYFSYYQKKNMII